MDIEFNKIEAIIFDLGGVIIDVDMNAPYHKLLEMSDRPKNELLKELKEIAYQYEIGKIEDQEFLREIKMCAEVDLSLSELEGLWNEMLGQVPDYMGELLFKISQEKRTFLLSNTNPIHIREVKKRFQKTISNYGFESLFEKIYYSHEINLHKPDLKIYDYVVKDSRLNPDVTLFIDDNQSNVLGAINYGLKAIPMTPPMSLPFIFPILR